MEIFMHILFMSLIFIIACYLICARRYFFVKEDIDHRTTFRIVVGYRKDSEEPLYIVQSSKELPLYRWVDVYTYDKFEYAEHELKRLQQIVYRHQNARKIRDKEVRS